jgi:hypothetical protein
VSFTQYMKDNNMTEDQLIYYCIENNIVGYRTNGDYYMITEKQQKMIELVKPDYKRNNKIILQTSSNNDNKTGEEANVASLNQDSNSESYYIAIEDYIIDIFGPSFATTQGHEENQNENINVQNINSDINSVSTNSADWTDEELASLLKILNDAMEVIIFIHIVNSLFKI